MTLFFTIGISPGYTLIMDNAAFHKSQNILELIEESGCKILFLLPYSPGLNPMNILG